MELVEVAFKRESFISPDSTEAFDELSAASVPLGMFQPPLAYASELCFEPAGDHIYGDASVRVVIDTGNLLSCYGGVPWAREESSDYIQLLGCVQEGLREGNRFVLVFLGYQDLL